MNGNHSRGVQICGYTCIYIYRHTDVHPVEYAPKLYSNYRASFSILLALEMVHVPSYSVVVGVLTCSFRQKWDVVGVVSYWGKFARARRPYAKCSRTKRFDNPSRDQAYVQFFLHCSAARASNRVEASGGAHQKSAEMWVGPFYC